VLDADKFSVVGTITGLKRCHGVLVMPELGKGFITDGDAGNVAVSILDAEITAETNFPGHGLDYLRSASKLVSAFNGDSKNATAIDPVKQTVVKVIPWAAESNIRSPMGRARSSMTTKRKTTGCPRHAYIQNQSALAHCPAGDRGLARTVSIAVIFRRPYPQFLVMMDAQW